LLEQCVETWEFLDFFFHFWIWKIEYSTDFYFLGKNFATQKKRKKKESGLVHMRKPHKGRKKKDKKKLTACTSLPPG
jgi:hypothetical protein